MSIVAKYPKFILTRLLRLLTYETGNRAKSPLTNVTFDKIDLLLKLDKFTLNMIVMELY